MNGQDLQSIIDVIIKNLKSFIYSIIKRKKHNDW